MTTSTQFPSGAGNPLAGAVNVQTSGYQVVAADAGTWIVVNSSGSVTVTLPTTPPTTQFLVGILSIGAGTTTVARNGNNINGAAANVTIAQNQGAIFTTDGTNWFVGLPTAVAPVTSVAGRTGAIVLAESDITNLVSDLALAAPLASPALTGAPTAPTASTGTNTTQLATTAFVTAAVGATIIVGATTRRQTLVTADGSSVTWQLFGETTPTITGSPTAEAPGAAFGPSQFISTASASTAVGWSGTLKNYVMGRNVGLFIIGYLNDPSTTERAWFGLTDQTLATMAASDNPAGNYAAFRFSTFAGDTHWECITKDGTTQNIISSGVLPPGVDVSVRFAIVCNDSVPNVSFYINGVLVGTSVSNLPTAGTALRWVAASFNTASGGSNGIGLEQVAIQMDY